MEGHIMSVSVNKGSVKALDQIRVTVTDKVRNYENDPFFVKKAEQAKENLRKLGLPKK